MEEEALVDPWRDGDSETFCKRNSFKTHFLRPVLFLFPYTGLRYEKGIYSLQQLLTMEMISDCYSV